MAEGGNAVGDLRHPIFFDGSASGDAASSSTASVTFFDALDIIERLYLDVLGLASGASGRNRGDSPASVSANAPTFVTCSSGPPKKGARAIAFFTSKSQVVPGGVMSIPETIVYPTPQGMATTTRARVLERFDGVFLSTLLKGDPESLKRLSQHSYLELDELRFAFTVVADLISKGGVFDPRGQLTGLAKRDIRKNCKAVVEATMEAHTPVSPSTAAAAGQAASGAIPAAPANSVGAGAKKGATGGAHPTPAKLSAEERQLKNILLDECAGLWPHTPPDKAAQFSIEQDPSQPKHKPLYRATVVLQFLKKMAVKGEWCRTKKDAENSAANAALRQLHSGKPK